MCLFKLNVIQNILIYFNIVSTDCLRETLLNNFCCGKNCKILKTILQKTYK